MDSSDDEIIDDKLKNRWLLQSVNGVRPETNKHIDTRWCLEHGADVNTRNISGDTPLHVVSRRGDAALVHLLLINGAKVNIMNRFGDTPLYLAVNRRDASITGHLLRHGAEVNMKNSLGNTALHKAVVQRDAIFIEQLLKYEANVNITNKFGYTPLHMATVEGHESIVDLLLKNGADVNIINNNGDTPLCTATKSGNTPIADLLLKFKADVNMADNGGNTPLHLAMYNNETSIVDLLLKNSANVNATNNDGETPLHITANHGHFPDINILLNAGANVNTKNKAGDTPLHIATLNEKVLIIADLILNIGIDVNTTDKDGNTPLHHAMYCNEATIADLLLKNGANVKTINKDGDTPLHIAAAVGLIPAIVLLLEYGANVNATNKTGHTPLHLAVYYDVTTIVDLLLQYGSNVNSINFAGNTPLHLAARRKNSAVADLLLRHGAKVTIKNLELDTPLTIARVFNFENHEEIVNILQTAEGLVKENISLSNDTCRSQTLSNTFQEEVAILNHDWQNDAHSGFIYSKRIGTSGACGQLYKTKMLCLVLIRALNDKEIVDFLLGTNICGIGNMDDICLRYRMRGQDRQVVLFIQAKHREDREKGKLTVEDVWSTSGDFCLRKKFMSYLKIKDRFQPNNDDPMFEGDFSDIECNLIIYTPVKERFTKKINRKVNEKVHNLINTGQNTEVFQYNYDDDEIYFLSDIAAIEQLKKLGIIFLELIMSEKVEFGYILMNKLITRYHVAMGRGVLQQCNIQLKNSEYRIWKFRPEFLESNCKYLVALKCTFIRELSTKRCDKSEITDEDLENVKLVIRNPCASTISKIIGKLVIYNDKRQRLLSVATNFKENVKEGELNTLLEILLKIDVNKSAINEAVKIKLTALKLKLPITFGNVDMMFCCCESEEMKQNRIKAASDKLIHLLELNKNTKIVDINDDIVGPGKIIEKDDIDCIGSAVGNLLVIDANTKMLKFDWNNKALAHNAALFLKELQHDRYETINEELIRYRFKMNIDGFPKYSFDIDEYDTKYARDFLSKLWFYTNQAKENEAERILKNHINTYYNYEKEPNNLLFEIHSNAIFLRSHNEIQKWWMQKGETYYLSRASDIFERTKLACINNLFLTVIDYMNHFNISSIDFKFNQRIHQKETCIQLPGAFNKIVSKLFEMFDTQNKSIDIGIENKKQIVNLLQAAEWLASENISPSSDRSQISCKNLKKYEPIVISHNDLTNHALRKFKYLNKGDTSGVSGQLYETKLLCLIHVRAMNDDQIEHFLLATNISGIGDMDDICLRYQVKGQDKPAVLFVQAKHRDDRENRKLTVDDVKSSSGAFSLRKYFESYLMIKDRFQVDNKDPMFEGNFSDFDCNLILYTPVKDCFTKKKTDRKINEKVHYLINTRQTTEVFQYNCDENDIDNLTKMTVLNQLNTLGTVFIELIMSEKNKSDVILMNKLIARYHVIMGREVLEQCKLEQEDKAYRIWKFHPDFFVSDCKYSMYLKRTFIRELSTKRCDKSEITDEDRENFKLVLQNPCASTISKIIGKLVIYNDKNKRLQLAVSTLKGKLKNNEFKKSLELLNEIVVNENIIHEAVQINLASLTMKLPLAFGNLDMTFRGTEAKILKRITAVAGKLIHLFTTVDSKIVDINDEVVGPKQIIERGVIDINGGIGSAVGNLLIKDTNTKMLKFDLNNKALPHNAALFLKELKSTKYKPVNEDLSEYRIKINIDGFPKDSFEGDEYDKKNARDFLNKLWFYTNQAKENEVEPILKDEIDKCTKTIVENNTTLRNNSNPLFLTLHNEIQKWWMQVDESAYLSRASELFERAELADVDNLLLTVVNYMYISKIYSIDLNIKQRVTDYLKFSQIHQTFSNLSQRLFYVFDSKFTKSTDIDLPAQLVNRRDRSDFSCVLVFSLEIHPEMEWVALKLFSKWNMLGRFSYSLIAKAGPGSGSLLPNDGRSNGFLLQQRFRGERQHFIEGGKDPLEYDFVDHDIP